MNRRAFLKRAGLIAAAVVVAPKVLFTEKLPVKIPKPQEFYGPGLPELLEKQTLSEESLEQARKDIAAFKSDRGLVISKKPEYLYIYPEWEEDARRIINSYK